MSNSKHSPAGKQAILDVVANQLRDNNPPEIRQTYERLIAAGFSDEDARILIGQVVACEIFDLMKKGETFDHKRFIERLAKLPDEPFDE